MDCGRRGGGCRCERGGGLGRRGERARRRDGQGGYGIQSADALGRLTAALASGDGVPADLAAAGVDAGLLARSRF